MSKSYCFNAEDFSVRLPWFYFDSDFSQKKLSKVWSFEVNGLTDLSKGNYDLRFFVRKLGVEIEFSWDGREYQKYRMDCRYFEIRNHPITNFMISCYWKDSGHEDKPPVEKVLLTETGKSFPESIEAIASFKKYVRNTLIEEREILKDWKSSYKIIMNPNFGLNDLKEMFKEIASWIKNRQVMDKNNIHYGAVYSEEDKYDFQDAAAASIVFMRMCKWTGDKEWLERSLIAKEYVYKGQHNDKKNIDRFGGFPSMGSFETNDYKRLSYPLPAVSGVATCIIGNLLIKLFEEGMEIEKHDVENIKKIGIWIVNNESHPGVFRHHEGDNQDCQNSNALGASILCRIYHFLKQQGKNVPEKWMEAVRRGINHVIEGQEAIGEGPYYFATIGRGQAYNEQSLPDQGMGLYHFLQAMQYEPFRSDRKLHEVILRAARWYLCTSDIEPGTNLVNLTFNPDDKGLAFSSFTWCRFMCAASLSRIWELTGERQPWQNLSLKLMEYVHKRLWNTKDSNRPPVVRSCVPDIKLVTWIQAVEWDAVLLLELIDRLKKQE